MGKITNQLSARTAKIISLNHCFWGLNAIMDMNTVKSAKRIF